MRQEITILVNSTDSFSDCWNPFFTLFSYYWPNCPYNIILNTEKKHYEHPGLNIKCSQVSGDERNLTWSECLQRCLDGINTDLLLYFQEDYFLNARVRDNQVAYFTDLMQNEKLDCIRLMECSGAGPWDLTDNFYLWEVDRKAKYRVSLQAALWRTTTLRALLKRHENPWQFESFGSKRASSLKYKIFCANRELYSKPSQQIIPYEPTGVIKGQWYRAAVYDLFKQHNIQINYSIRGFFDRDAYVPKKRPVLTRVYDRVRSFA